MTEKSKHAERAFEHRLDKSLRLSKLIEEFRLDNRLDNIEERGGEFFIMSDDGEELEGPISSEEKAEARLGEIEAAKAERGNSDSAVASAGVASPGSGAPAARRFDYLDALHTDPKRTDGLFMEQDPSTGFLRGDARPARTGVLEYQDAAGNRWGELRTDGEVFSDPSLRSYDIAVITDDHPADFVDTKNVKDVQVGSVGSDARRDGRFVRVSILVTDGPTIQAIRDGKRELSCGYTAQVISDSGVADGTPFAGRQTNIRINHIAIVDKGRAGAECSVLARGDAYHITTGEVPVTTKKIKIGDVDHEVSTEIKDAIEAERAAHKLELEAKADAVKADAAPPPPTVDNAALQAKLDVLEAKGKADAESFSARVDARSRLIAVATTHGIPTDGVTDAALKRAVVLKVLPSMEAKLDAHKGDGGYLEASYDNAIDLDARRDAALKDTNTVVFDALNGGGANPLVKALTSYANRGEVKS